ncbi:MAG: universal stress protein [Polyangiales bacterium]
MQYTPSLQTKGLAPRPIRRILCPIDFSGSSIAALKHSIRLAAEHHASVEVLHVWEVPSFTGGAPVDRDGEMTLVEYVQREAAKRLDELLSAQGDAASESIHGRLESGDAVSVIIDAARNADLVIMGAHGGGSISEMLLGDVADRVVSDAPCAVMTLCDSGAVEDLRPQRLSATDW